MPRQRAVGAWFATYENPHTEAMLLVRAFILETEPRVAEAIKWQTPTFTYQGNIASFTRGEQGSFEPALPHRCEDPGNTPAPGRRRRYSALHVVRHDERSASREEGIQEVIPRVDRVEDDDVREVHSEAFKDR